MARPTPAVSRALAILDFLMANPGRGYSLSELARHTRVSVASAHAILAVLEDEGYLVRHPAMKTYTLGPLLVALGSAALEQHPALDAARDAARRLARSSGREMVVVAPARNRVVALVRVGRRDPRGFEVGRGLPFLPPHGLVFLAWSGEADFEQWFERLGPNRTVEDQRHLLTALALSRRLGFVVTLRVDVPFVEVEGQAKSNPEDESLTAEFYRLLEKVSVRDYHPERLEMTSTYEITGIVAPIFDAEGRPALAMSMFGFRDAMSGAEILEVGRLVRDTAWVVTRETGGVLPTSVEF